jgi:hypothetical protein
MTAQAAIIPRKIPGALRQPKIATIATKKTAGIMKIEGFIVFVCVWVKSEISAILAFVKFGSVKVSAFLLPAILSITSNGFCGWVVKDLLATLHFALTTSAG